MHPLCNGSDLAGLHPSDWIHTLNQFPSLLDPLQQHFSESLIVPSDPNFTTSLEQEGFDPIASLSGIGSANLSILYSNNNFSNANNESYFNETSFNHSYGINCTILENVLQELNLSSLVYYEDPMYFSRNYRIVGTFFQSLIFLIGVLGNILVVFVVARTKSMHSPTNCYLVSLAVADCIVLIASIPQDIVSYYIVGSRWVWGEVGCASLVFLTNLGINASSLSLAAFTVERYIAICKPFLAQTMCTVNRAKKIIFGVWIFAFIYCFPWLFLTATFPIFYKGYSNIQTCQHKLSREQYLGYYFADIIVFYLIPLVLSVVLYAKIARILYRSQSSKPGSGGSVSGGPGSAGGGGYMGSSTGNGNLTTDLSKPNAARVQVVKMLVMVVVIFAILWLPYRGMLVYNSLAKEKFMDLWYLMLCKTCVYINSAINPILYNAMSVKFRRAFGRTLFCGKKRDSFERWPYCRSQPTYTTVSTALPSTSTLTLVTPPLNKNNLRAAARSSYCGAQNILSNSTQNKSNLTVEVVIDSGDNFQSHADDVEITQL